MKGGGAISSGPPHGAEVSRKASKYPFIYLAIIVILALLTILHYRNAPRRLIKEGLKYREERKSQAAVSSFKKALSFNRTSSSTLTLLGEEYQGLMDFTRSRYYFEGATKCRAIDSRAYYYLGEIMACRGEHVAVTRLLKEGGERSGSEGRNYLLLLRLHAAAMFPGRQEFEVGPEEERKIQETLARSPHALFFKVHCGLIAIYRKRFDEASGVFGELARAHPRDSYLKAYEGIALMGSGKKVEALMALNSAVQLDEKNPVAHEYLGALYLEEKSLDESLRALKTALDLNPRSPGATCFLGILHLGKGELNRARVYLEESLLRQPNDGLAHKTLTEVYEKLNMKKEAREEHEKEDALNGPLLIGTPPY
jgi:tetratricopeptide (TPR) repeat protein